MSLNLLAHFGGEVVTRVVTKGDVGTLARKHFANCRTYATRSSGYERALSLKQETHLTMFLLEVDGDYLFAGRLNREKAAKGKWSHEKEPQKGTKKHTRGTD
jgi:hypothetical protein